MATASTTNSDTAIAPARFYREIEIRSWRNFLKSRALDALSLTSPMAAAFSKPRVQFLYLHYVFEDEEAPFRSLIESLLQRDQQFLSYTDAVHRVAEGPIDSPSLNFSFDDGVANCLQAARILHEYSVSACFFLSSGLLGENRTGRKMLMTATQHACKPVEYMSWADAEKLIELGHEIGGHTTNHVDIAKLKPDQYQDEIRADREILQQRLGNVDHFAWPFGRAQNINPEARDAVFNAGYRTCASAIRGAHTQPAGNNQFCIRRDNILAAMPVRHSMYLIGKSAQSSDASMNDWFPMDESDSGVV
ncbi:MAG: polysaccharide deacetylase family protein [Rubripirellula sp.]